MPLKIKPVCRHCGKPVAQGKDLFSMWFHTGRHTENNNRRCDPMDPNSKLALPSLEVVKRGNDAVQG